MTHTPKTPIEKIGDHLLLYAGDALEERAVPIASVVLTMDYGDLIVTVPGGGARISGWTTRDLLRVMYPPTSYTTSGRPMTPIEPPADWGLDLSEIEDEPAPRIRPGSLPARALDELDDDWATASIVAERLGGVAIASTSQALRSLCERGLAERAKHPISRRYMYRTTGANPGMAASDRILAALRSRGEPMTARQLIEAVAEFTPNTIYSTIRRAEVRGAIRKVLVGDPGYIAYEIAEEEAGK